MHIKNWHKQSPFIKNIAKDLGGRGPAAIEENPKSEDRKLKDCLFEKVKYMKLYFYPIWGREI